MTRHLLTFALLCCAVPAPAQPAPREPACLQQVNIHDYQLVPQNRSLVVIDRARQRYRVNFITKCYDLQYKLRLRFQTLGVSRLACLGRGDKVLFQNPADPGAGFCIIHDVQYQTPAMDAQDAAGAAATKQQ
jgi:hypothetical protein